MNSPRIVVVDEDGQIAEDYALRLRNLGYAVVGHAPSGEKALEIIENTSPDLVLMDVRPTGGMDGIETAGSIQSRGLAPVVVITDQSDEDTLAQVKEILPFGYIIKPFRDLDLKITLEMALFSARVDRERRDALSALKQSEEKLAGILGAITDCVSMIDENMNLVWANNVVMDMFGRDIIGKRCFGVFNRKNHACENCMVIRTLRDGQVHEHETEVITKDGRRLYFWCTTSVAAWNEDGRPKLVVGVFRDITSKHLTERKLLEAKVAAEKANLAKSEFMANVSHELRHPLTPIIGFSDLLLLWENQPKHRDYLLNIKTSAQQLLGSVDDLLELSRMEAGWLELEETTFRLDQLLKSLILEWGPVAEKKKLELKCNIDPKTRTMLVGDIQHIKKILSTLIQNSIKFTEKGSIEIQISVNHQSEDQLLLEFTVSDTGIGIPSDKIPIIFDSFTQADGSPTRKHGGLGLGLTKAKRLTQYMGGSIQVESREGEGCRFHISLPVKPAN